MDGTVTVNANVGGVSIQGTIVKSAAGSVSVDKTGAFQIPAAKTGTLSTRTNNTDGTITGQASHGIATSDVMDIYWTTGSGGKRKNVAVGTVSGNSIPISGGTGDNLPTQGDALTLQKQQLVDVDFLGDLMYLLVATCNKKSTVQFFESSTSRLTLDFDGSGAPYLWALNNGVTNPLATYAISTIKVTQSDSANAADMKAGVLYASG